MDDLANVLVARLLATSVQTALLVTVIWLLCRFMRRLSPSSQCWLWWLVALQAVLGLFASPVELPLLPDAPGGLSREAPWAIAGPDVAASWPSRAPAISQNWFTWQSTAVLMWVAGALVMAWVTVRDWQRGKLLVKHSAACNDEQLLAALDSAARTCGTRNVPMLRLSGDIESPVLIGLRRPVLLLPAINSMSAMELDMALAHELTHLRRGDLWLSVIPALARHLFFFHPLVHLATREYGIAREAACDAGVVDSGRRSRRDYGRLLVRLGTAPASRMDLPVASPTFHALQRRLSLLQTTAFLPRTLSIALLGVIAATGVLPVRLVAAAAPAPTNPTSGSLARDFLDKQIEEYELRLTEAETRLAEFKRRTAPINSREPEVELKLEQLARDYETVRARYEALVRRGHVLELAKTGDKIVATRRVEQVRPGEAASQAASAAPASAAEPYKIATGDKLFVSVWQHPELGVEVPVRPDGRVSTPFVEDMVAAGKTTSQLARDIESVLAKYVRSPKVTVILK